MTKFNILKFQTPPRQSVNTDTVFNQSTENLPAIPIPDSNDESQPQKDNDMIIKARPLTIRKPPMSEQQPKLRNLNAKNGVSVSINRRIEMPPAFLFPEMDMNNEMPNENGLKRKDEVDRAQSVSSEESRDNVVSDITEQISSVALSQDSQEEPPERRKKGNLKQGRKAPLTRRVSFDPLALLLDASLEGELELVKKTATQVNIKLIYKYLASENAIVVCQLLDKKQRDSML